MKISVKSILLSSLLFIAFMMIFTFTTQAVPNKNLAVTGPAPAETVPPDTGTPVPTNIVPPTSTIAPTSGVTKTPVPPVASCTDFQDVPTTDPFYKYIQCLSCNNIVSGYSCGVAPAGQCVPPDNLDYFLPGNYVTRAQMMKIVSNSANYTNAIPSSQQSFADVPPTDPFWLYIERAYAHTIISGYNCGGAGEPCDSQNRPYFRPANNMTRAQAAKVVTLALPQQPPPIGSQVFADVPPTDPFYVYIQNAAHLNVIDGYACGGVGEPCDSLNSPYFRPTNNVTRAQAAKMNAIEFNCQLPATVTTTPPPGVCAGNVDVNCDGAVNVLDYLYFYRYQIQGAIPSTVNLDVDRNGTIDNLDKNAIINAIVGSGGSM